MTKRKRRSELEAREVLELFREAGRPLDVRQVLRILGLKKREKEHVRHILDGFVREGRMVQVGQGYGLPERMRMVTGRLEVQRSGVGFVIPDDKRRRDIFVNPREFGGAWHGDRVAVVLTREARGSMRPEGRIARVIERATQTLAVRVLRRLSGGLWSAEPVNPKYALSVLIETDEKLAEDEVLEAEVGEQVDRHVWRATVVERYGEEDSAAVQERIVKAGQGVPTRFPDSALREAEALPEAPPESDFQGRRDMRQVGFVTIDGAKARDFDDAIYVKRKGKGHTLWVAIADVAHYVQPGSGLDREAFERGNSYYFPQSVEPMFPERLSNGLCSLNPNVPRLAMVAEIDFDAHGLPGRTDFYAAVIESHARLTYAQVGRALLDKDEEERARIDDVLPMLETAEELARRINARRGERGSLDFDLPEPEIHFNIYGETVDIRPMVRTFAHQLIEEFMVAANEAVARFLTERDLGLLYRIHPAPDPSKVEALFTLLAGTELGPKLPHLDDAGPSPKDLQRLLTLAEGSSLEFLVGRLTLRTMMQAKYSPDNEGHYGLASECYAHFTSPIRRYADLVVHRVLKGALGVSPGAKTYGYKRLKEIGDHISGRERVAMEAEREILKRVTILFLRERVGEEFTGVINGLADFGFWVELNEVMAEGMVRLSTLGDDYYQYLSEQHMLLGERTGRVLRLGQSVKVALANVSLPRLEVNLELIETLTPAFADEDPDYPTPIPEPRRGKQQPKGGRKPSGRKRGPAAPRGAKTGAKKGGARKPKATHRKPKRGSKRR